MDKQDLIATYTACAGHDYNHIGLENGCYELLYPKLVSKYSIEGTDFTTKKQKTFFSLEKFHAAKVLEHLEKLGTFEKFKRKDDMKKIVKLGIERTDGHFSNENVLNGLVGKNKFTNDEKIDLIAALIHGADVSNPTKPLEIYRKWALRVVKEFLNQGVVEKEKGHPSQKYQPTLSLQQRQINFIAKYLQLVDFFGKLGRVIPELSYLATDMNENLKHMEAEEKDPSKRLADTAIMEQNKQEFDDAKLKILELEGEDMSKMKRRRRR
ncbi:MAG: 3',5'-cyclic nucleotide phosphodiesterase [archaeon]|nr:3',5'-cyclic nucleotide phosphodiesterase [archaeon]